MSFGAPGYLALLALIPVTAVAAGFWARWRAGVRRQLGPRTAARSGAAAAAVLLLAALAFAAVAAARPQIGHHDVRAADRGIDLVIVLDVSNSMLAGDVPPTRLGRAQAEISALLDRLSGDRVALVIFARDAFVRSPLTSDLRALRSIVDGVDGERPLVSPGSDLGSALRAGQKLLAAGDSQTKAMLVVSDGEERSASSSDAVAAVAGAGARIYTAGAGTTEGAPVQDINPITKQASPRVDPSGNAVITRLGDARLRDIARAGGGRYVALDGSGALARLAPEFDLLAKTDFGSTASPEPIEWFQVFAVVSLLLVVAGLLLPLAARFDGKTARAAMLAGGELLAGGLLAGALCSAGVSEVNRRGNDEYDRSQFEAALAQYRTAEALDAARPELAHNAGNALDREGAYDRAVQETQRVRAARSDLAAKLQYALGHHLVGAGRLAEALNAYREALLRDPADEDAKHNLEVVLARLTPTPRPRPTPTPAERPSSPAAGGTPAPQPSSVGGAPTAGAAAGPTAPSGEPSPSPGEAQRMLSDALAGGDRQFSEEEALRILDLLDRANQGAADKFDTGSPALHPDY